MSNFETTRADHVVNHGRDLTKNTKSSGLPPFLCPISKYDTYSDSLLPTQQFDKKVNLYDVIFLFYDVI